jgi:hypothetical protein
MVWIASVLVVAVAVSLIRGGKLTNLTDLYLRGWWLFVLGFVIQAGAAFVPRDVSGARDIAMWMLLGSYLLLLLGILLNRGQAGIALAGVGILMNFAVIAANSGMPVSIEAATIAGGGPDLVLGVKHVVLDQATRLPFLADVLPLPGSVISLGDVFLALGLGIYLERAMRKPVRFFRHGVPTAPGSAAER